MKTYALFIVTLCFAFNISSAGIENGYTEILGANASLNSIRMLLESKALSMTEKQSMKGKKEALINYIAWHHVTEKFIAQFKIISPALYNELDTLKDSK